MSYVFIDNIQFAGVLEQNTPENPDRGYVRSGATLKCMAGLTAPGKYIHVDNGCDESSGFISMNVSLMTQERLDELMAKYKSTTPITVQVGDLTGNVYTCVFKPGTQAVKPTQIRGWPNLYRVQIEFNIVARTSGSTP